MAVSNVSSKSPNMGIRMPTAKELQKVYAGIVDQKEKDGTLKKLSKPPAGWDKVGQPVNVNEGRMGVGREVYTIKGELYLKTQVVVPNAKPQWFKVGPQPMF